MIRTLRTIDAHVAGQGLRLVTEGFPTPSGSTMLGKQEWMAEHADGLRASLLREPRGHEGMTGACFTVPVSAEAHAGVLFMHGDGYAGLCGHGLIGAVTIGIEKGLLFDRAADAARERTVRVDTVCGLLSARARLSSDGRVESVAVTLPPALVVAAGHALQTGGRVLRVDIAWCGAFYAIVDAESAGLVLDASGLPELRRAGMRIAEALSHSAVLRHPDEGVSVSLSASLDAGLDAGLDAVVFTGPPRAEDAHLVSAAVFTDGAVDRSPCGGATAAVMAVLDAMGLMLGDAPFVHESLIGTRFTGRIVSRTEAGGVPAVVPEIEGSAWITGEHTFHVDERDPLSEGFRL